MEKFLNSFDLIASPPPKKKFNVLNANEDVHWLLKLKQSNITRDAEYGVSGFSMENNCNHTHP